MSKIDWKAVVVGAVVDIVASNVLVGALAIYVSLSRHLSGDTGALLDYMRTDPVLSVVSIVLGSAASILGGYVAAHIARQAMLLNAVLASFLCVASAVVALFEQNSSILVILLDIVASPLLSLLGGYIRLWQIDRKTTVI